MVQDTASQRELVKLYVRLLPLAMSCKIALLLGDRPPVRFIFDVVLDSVITTPFLSSFFQLNKKNYLQNDCKEALNAAILFLVAAGSSGTKAEDGVDKATGEKQTKRKAIKRSCHPRDI